MNIRLTDDKRAQTRRAQSKPRLIMPSSRAAFVTVALVFALLVLQIYLRIIVYSGVYDYMGIRAHDVPFAVTLGSLLLAALPALWLPKHIQSPTHLVGILLFYCVHVPTCVLVPIVSERPISEQLLFLAAVTAATSALCWRVPLPALTLPQVRQLKSVFWVAFLVLSVCVLGLFYQSGYLSLANFHLIEVYAQRLELMARSEEIGRAFFYAANWTSTALVPFLIIAGLHQQRYVRVLAAVALAVVAFIVSSNKMGYYLVPAVVAAYFAFKRTNGRHFPAILGLAFSVLGLALVTVDLMRGAGPEAGFPMTWAVFFRTFCNNGFLSAIYLDVFSVLPPALYTDSFMRALLPRQFELSVPALAGASFSEVPDVHANANLWADGFANLHYLGFIVAVFSAWITFWIYASVTRRHDQTVAATGLVAYAFTLANTSVHTAVVSNGFFVMCLLLYSWPGGRTQKQ